MPWYKLTALRRNRCKRVGNKGGKAGKSRIQPWSQEWGLSWKGLPTFGTGECALRHEERLNGGRLCLLLAANATSVSMAPRLRYFPWLKLEEKHSNLASRKSPANNHHGQLQRKKPWMHIGHAVFPQPISAQALEKMKGRESWCWTLIDSTLPEVSGYDCGCSECAA